MDRRLSRRKLALSIGALVLAVPGVSACGFNYATDRENTDRQRLEQQGRRRRRAERRDRVGRGRLGDVHRLAGQQRPAARRSAFETLDFGSNSTIEVAAFSPIEVPPHGLVNLSDGQGIKVSGDFKAGEFVGLSLDFDNGESAELDALVVSEDNQYTGLDNGTGEPSPAATESAS
jgi:hypothetical protein